MLSAPLSLCFQRQTSTPETTSTSRTAQAYFWALRPTASMKTVITGSCAPRLSNNSANLGTT